MVSTVLEGHGSAGMGRIGHSKARESVQSQRLLRLRNAMGYETDTAWCVFLGIPVQRWSNVINGVPVSRDLAFLLVRKVAGLTLDYIYFGKTEGLPLNLARQLGELPDLPAGGRNSTTRSPS